MLSRIVLGIGTATLVATLATQSVAPPALANSPASVGIIGTNSSTAIASHLRNAGFAVTEHGSTLPSRGVMDQHEKIVLLRTAGNADLAAWVRDGGVLVTEWDASSWALNSAGLISATDTGGGNVGSGTPVTFSSSTLGSTIRGTLPNPYSDAGSTQFFRTFTGIGGGVEILASRSGSIPAIIGGDAGTGYVFLIGYDWADEFVSGSNNSSLLVNVLNASVGTAPPTLAATTVAGITTNAATLGGNVTATGGVAVTDRGVVWSTSPNPVRGSTCTSGCIASGSGTGTFTVEATGLNPGETYYARAYATNSAGTAYGAEVTFTAQQLDQSITWNEALENRSYSLTTFSLSATASSDLAVAFSSVDASVCTVDGVSVTMLRSGTCTLRASQAGNVTYAAAPHVDRSFTIAKAAQTIAFSVPSGRTYAPETFSVSSSATTSATDNSLAVTFASETPTVCTVAAATVTVVAAGTCTLTAAQSGNDRYLPATPESGSFEIARRVLSLSGSRVYDGTRDTPAAALPTVGNLASGQTLTFSGTATSLSPDVGARTLDVTGITLGDGTGGGLASNYTLDGGSHEVTITPRPVRGAFTAAGRTYDGTATVDDALVSGRTLGAIVGTPASGVVPVDGVLDDVALDGGVATFASTAADESTPTTVTLSGATLAGSRAANYTLQSVATTTATVSRRPVTVTGTFSAQDRQYDGTASATVTSNALLLTNTVGADAVTLVPVVAFDTPDAGGGRIVRLAGSSTLSGADASNYRLDLTGAPTTTASIIGRPLTIASGSFNVADKVYDGTDAATVSAHSLVLTGFAAGDSMADISWTPTGRFTLDTAGTGRTVELVGGAVLSGAKGGGYTLDVTGAPTAVASITPRPVTVTGASAAGRPYDGTTSVTVSGATLANTVAGDVVSLANATSGVAASRNAGTQAVSTSMTLTGANAANYRLSGQPSLSVTITPLPVSVAMNALPSRPYDGTNALSLTPSAFTVSGVLPGESIAVSGTGRLSSRAAGTRTVTVTPTYTPGGGTELANYVLPASVNGTVTVTPLPLRIVGATVTSRAWDGSTSATITGAALEGVRAGDAVSLAAASSGEFAMAQPGTHPVRFTPSLVGVDAINYSLTVPELTGTITRAPATLRITGGLLQFADGSPRSIRAAVSPTDAGRIVVSYGGDSAPTEPGSYPVTVTLDSPTHAATALSATLTLQPVEALPDVVASRPDGTLALPEIGPILEADGTAPALRPTDRHVLEDGEPVEARVVVQDDRVRVESGDGFAIEFRAGIGEGESRTPLPVDVDGTLLLYRGGFVDVSGRGYVAESTVEVWMFSNATLLGTAIVSSDGSFAGSFPVDALFEVGEHTIQVNGIASDGELRSASLGVRIEDLEDSARERFVFASERGDGPGVASSPAWLLMLAALIGAGIMRWWIVGRRRRDEEDAGALALRS